MHAFSFAEILPSLWCKCCGALRKFRNLEILKLGWFTRLRLEAYSLQFTAYSLKLTAYGLTPNLKLTIPRCARKGNDIAYIGHTGNEHHQSFESESKTGVLAGSRSEEHTS